MIVPAGWDARTSFVTYCALTAAEVILLVALCLTPDNHQRQADKQQSVAERARPNTTEDSSKAKDSANQPSPYWSSLLWNHLPEWTLAVVTALTLGAILEQVDATRSATAQADRHFKIANQQWLDVSEWTLSVETAQNDATLRLLFSDFVVTNNTNMPLTLDFIECILTGGPPIRWIAGVGDKIGPRGGRFRPVPMLRPLDAPNIVAAYDNPARGFGFLVIGKLHYTDAFGDLQTQLFGRAVHIGHGGITKPRDTPRNLKLLWDTLDEHIRKNKAPKSEE